LPSASTPRKTKNGSSAEGSGDRRATSVRALVLPSSPKRRSTVYAALASAGAFGAGAAAPPAETLSAPGTNVWGTLYRGLTSREVTAPRAVMAVRPDGVMVVGAPLVRYSGVGGGLPLLFYFFPTYRADSCEERIPAADPFRAAEPRGFIAGRKPVTPEAMVLLPGAPAGTDFGHFKRPAPVPCTAGAGPDAGVPMPDGGSGGADGGGGGGGGGPPCGCETVTGLTLVFAFAVLPAMLRRRRR